MRYVKRLDVQMDEEVTTEFGYGVPEVEIRSRWVATLDGSVVERDDHRNVARFKVTMRRSGATAEDAWTALEAAVHAEGWVFE